MGLFFLRYCIGCCFHNIHLCPTTRHWVFAVIQGFRQGKGRVHFVVTRRLWWNPTKSNSIRSSPAGQGGSGPACWIQRPSWTVSLMEEAWGSYLAFFWQQEFALQQAVPTFCFPWSEESQSQPSALPGCQGPLISFRYVQSVTACFETDYCSTDQLQVLKAARRSFRVRTLSVKGSLPLNFFPDVDGLHHQIWS